MRRAVRAPLAALACLFVAELLTGCMVDFAATPSPGAEGGICRATAPLCDPGFTCLSKICVKPAAPGDLGPARDAKAPASDSASPGSDTGETAKDLSAGTQDADPRNSNACLRGPCVWSVAGGTTAGLLDGPTGVALFASPAGIAIDPSSGAIYVADRDNHRIRRILGGRVSTIAGVAGVGLQDGALRISKLHRPSDLALGADGTLYVSDQENHRIRALRAGVVTTIAGSVYGFRNGPAKSAMFRSPAGVAIDASGVLYVTDAGNQRIRALVGTEIITLAGSGAAALRDGPALEAQFKYPQGVAVGADGALFFADRLNHCIRVLHGGQVTTVAGREAPGFVDGAFDEALFNTPAAVLVDSAGRVYVADEENNRIRVIEGGSVRTVAGDGEPGMTDGAAAQSRLNRPAALALGPDGTIYIADQGNHRIRALKP